MPNDSVRNRNLLHQCVVRNRGANFKPLHSVYSFRDDDDINDVATMGGVNLSEETKNILAAVPESSGQLRSCRDNVFLAHTPLAQKIRNLGNGTNVHCTAFGHNIIAKFYVQLYPESTLC